MIPLLLLLLSMHTSIITHTNITMTRLSLYRFMSLLVAMLLKLSLIYPSRKKKRKEEDESSISRMKRDVKF